MTEIEFAKKSWHYHQEPTGRNLLVGSTIHHHKRLFTEKFSHCLHSTSWHPFRCAQHSGKGAQSIGRNALKRRAPCSNFPKYTRLLYDLCRIMTRFASTRSSEMMKSGLSAAKKSLYCHSSIFSIAVAVHIQMSFLLSEIPFLLSFTILLPKTLS